MRTEKIIWGLILVFTGSILLLQNFGIIDFYWQVIFRFWPVILILIGANLAFSRDDSAIGGVISVLLTLLALGFITYKGITTTESNDLLWFFNKNDRIERDATNNILSEPYNDSISKAILNISGGATQYILKDTTNNLLFAEITKSFGKYSLMTTFEDSTRILNLNMRGKSGWEPGDDTGNKVAINLNNKPVWDINVEMGAGMADFDLSPFKVNNLSIQGGAASFKIKLGEPAQKTTVSVETGVSEIEVSVPHLAACKINVESGLSSNNFEGFTRQADGSYRTKNFKNSSKAILLNLKGGLSEFRVKQY